MKNIPFSKAQRMLLGSAIGDAFGRAYEGKSRDELVKKFNFEEYSSKPKYTDDMQMTLAVAELLISPYPINEETLASNFVYAYRRDKRSGYSDRTQTKLDKSYCGKDFLKEAIDNPKPTSNGSAMRAMPLGLIKDVKKVIEFAILNSKITHNHPNSIKASVGIALIGHYFYYNLGPAKNIIKFIISKTKDLYPETNSYLEEVDKLKEIDYKVLFQDKHDYGLPCDALKTLGIVLFILKKYYDNTSEALKESILIGGDVDSSGSLVLGAELINHNLETLPAFLFNDLENKKFGRDYILKIGKILGEKYS